MLWYLPPSLTMCRSERIGWMADRKAVQLVSRVYCRNRIRHVPLSCMTQGKASLIYQLWDHSSFVDDFARWQQSDDRAQLIVLEHGAFAAAENQR